VSGKAGPFRHLRSIVAVIGGAIVIALGVWVLVERAATTKLEADIIDAQHEHDEAAALGRRLHETLGEYETLLDEVQRRETEVVQQIAEHQKHLELLRDKTDALEEVSLELTQLSRELGRYEQAEREYRRLLEAIERHLLGQAKDAS